MGRVIDLQCILGAIGGHGADRTAYVLVTNSDEWPAADAID
jgi:hypothetical protein